MDVVKLKNGAEEVEPLVKVTMMVLRDLWTKDVITAYELVMCCRDRDHQPFGNTEQKLRDRSLYPIHDSIRNIVLSSVTGDLLEMQLGSPVAEKEPSR